MSTPINDGGPAFPGVETRFDKFDGERYIGSYGGMTLRDWFAGQALGALVKEALEWDHKSWAATAEHAYIIADAMLSAREVKS